MGLNHPVDLAAWRRWQQRQHSLRRVRDLVRTPTPTQLWLHRRGEVEPTVLAVLDATTPSAVGAYAEPVSHLRAPVAVLAPGDVRAQLPGAEGTWRVERLLPGSGLSGSGAPDAALPDAGVPAALAGVRVMLASGHFLPVSAIAFEWARTLGARFAVAQHGLMTPFAPPLPAGAHLLAFTEADAEFWRSGRGDLTHEVVGSQLLWRAAGTRRSASTPGQAGAQAADAKRPGSAKRAADAKRPGSAEQPADATWVGSAGRAADANAAPVFLGQLHGAELARRTSAATVTEFCRRTGASYRPHPAETDLLSRLQHRRWERRGITVDRTGEPLAELRRPIVSVFSTGVLEAAAAGAPSWVFCVNPPAWVEEFWQRYGLHRWGETPTPAPPVPEIEPARAIAGALDRLIAHGDGATR